MTLFPEFTMPKNLIWLSVVLLAFNIQTRESVAQDSIHYLQKSIPAYSNPCGDCPNGPRGCKTGLWNLPGYGGQPNRESSIRISLIDSNQRPGIMRFSSYWPAPMHSVRDHGMNGFCNRSTCQPRPRDAIDSLAYFKLVPKNIRTDNGHSGPNCDPYGFLGQSRSYENHPATVPHYLNRRYPSQKSASAK